MEKYTLRDIAEMAGVSPATVSRAFNNPSSVRQDKLEKIFSFASSTGYGANSGKKPPAANKSNVVALFVGDMRNTFYSQITYHAQNALISLGYHPVVFNKNFILNAKNSDDFLEPLINIRPAGIFMLSVTEPPGFIEQLQSIGCPIVMLLNCSIKNFDGSVVVQDNYQAGYIAARHLIELGHKDIAFLSGPTGAFISNARLEGIRNALNYNNYQFSDDALFVGDLTLDCGRIIAVQYLERLETLPRAVICCNDLMAIGFIDECRKRNIQVPEQISVLGFDDITFSSLEGIALTTMRQPMVEMSLKGVELLHKKILDPSCSNEYIIMDPKLIVRKTTMSPFTG